MAFIVKGEDGPATYRSALANAGPDSWSAYQRQRDAYILAKMGSRDMKRLWNDYAAECPAMARLVVADVEKERAEGARVSEGIDKRLRVAEQLVTKSWKPPKKPKKVTKSAGQLTVTKLARRAAQDRQEAVRAEVAADLNSADPNTREAARAILRGGLA